MCQMQRRGHRTIQTITAQRSILQNLLQATDHGEAITEWQTKQKTPWLTICHFAR